jgi:O-antigen/teichoic acid export membrane protein
MGLCLSFTFAIFNTYNMSKLQLFTSTLLSQKSMVIADQLVTSGGSFVTTIILARQLGIADFGIYSTIVMVLYLVLSVSTALIVSPYQVLQANSSNPKAYVSALLLWQVVLCGVLTLVSLPLLVLDFTWIESIKPFVYPSLLLMVLFLVQDFLRKILLANQKANQALIIDAITVGLQLFWFGISYHELNLQYALTIVSVTYIPSIVVGVFFIKPVLPTIKLMLTTAVTQYQTGKWLLLTAVLQWWAGNLFVMASGFFLGMKALGALRLAQTLFGVLNVLLQVFENHTLPVAARLYQQSETVLKKYLWNTTRKSTFLMLPITLLLVVFAKEIFLLSGGKEYVEYAYALQGMAVLYLVIFAGYSARIAIRVLSLNKDFFVGYLFTLVFSLIGAQYFIQHWGILGVIAGLLINQLVLQAYWQFILVRKNLVLWTA